MAPLRLGGGDGVVGRRWWMLGVSSRACGHPPVVSPCRVILVSACRRGAIYDARCRPQAARCRPHGQSRVLGGSPQGVGFACGFALPGDGRHKWRPYVWCGGDGWLAAGGGCWVSRRGVFCWRACLSCRGVRSCCRGVRRIGCCGGMDKWTVGGGADGGVWTGQ